MAVTLTWIYTDHLKSAPQRRYKVKGQTGFAFSDVRRIMAEEILETNFNRFCLKDNKTINKSFITDLFRMVA